MGEPPAQRAQRLDLLRVEPRLVDLAQREGQVVHALAALGRGSGELRALGVQLAQAAVQTLDLGAEAERVAVAIQQAPVHLRPQQRLRIVLARDLDASEEQLLERGDGHQLAADARAAAAGPRQRAVDDQLVLAGRESAPLELRFELGTLARVEDALDDRLVAALAHRLRVRAPARQQRQRSEHHRLARAGLARQHVEPGPERELDLVHDREIPDAQRLDQRSPQRSFARITWKRLRPGGTSSRTGCSARCTRTRSPSASASPTWPSTVR